MVHTLTEPAEVPSGSPVRPHGILAVAQPAPEGWENGGIETSSVCPDPIVRDKCITLPAGDEAGRPEVVSFPAFMIEQGSGCSTLSGDARGREAMQALTDSTDFALGLTLRTGEANDGAPSLSDADDLGTAGDIVTAVSQIECAAATQGSGLFYVLHATVGAAPYLVAAGMIDGNGLSPSGAPWIISSGYGCEEGDDQRIWATGRVWAAAGAITVQDAIHRRMNNREAWAARSAIVGFNPCINLTIAFPAQFGGGGMPGPAGASAYEIAVENGFEGTEQEWLASLVGPAGQDGVDGTDGADGQDGAPGVVQSVVAGDGITVDTTDPANPIVAAG